MGEPIKRLDKDTYYLNIALAVSKRSTCLKRHYGCVIVKNDSVIATGYNGSARNQENCCDKGQCERMNVAHNSGNYADCPAVHAEQNALLLLSRSETIGAILYLAGEDLSGEEPICMTDCKPCPICERMIMNSGIIKVVGKKKAE